MKTIISVIIAVLLSCTSFVYAQQNIPSDFPKYQNTGNQKADNTAYDQAKKAWVETNPEAYQKMGGQIQPKPNANENSPETPVENCEKTDGLTIAIPDNCITWKITDAVLIDENNQLTTSELQKEQTGFKEEMLTRKVLWKISPEGMLYILNDGKYITHFEFEKTNNQLKLFPPYEEICGNEIQTFHIKKWTDSKIIINIPDEDEGSTLVYQLTLTPTF